ncbi:hypothetical protein H2198_002083 [Neophaeococcomyces mojaviensis]|uniref:Uncharacterized protein n=1 Tax=Neophaeococcomyces mojaviensis TaxID=3383035 RepID=A0ACC3AFI4_9EURO|nr:hypothetical protein H2198_002083 [Knufia sp. JES_112]
MCSRGVMQGAPDYGGNTERAPKRPRLDEAEGEITHAQDNFNLVQEYQRPTNRSYAETTACGNATMLQGDNNGILVIGQSPCLQPGKYDILLQSLTFERMDARLRNVAKALPKTCEWLFRHKQFAAWIDDSKADDHHGFLWIKGKPGSGKSTIIKSVYQWAKRKWSKQVIISYFFNARAPGQLERSSLGLYRSLVHQILSSFPDAEAKAKTAFLTKFSLKEKDGVVDEWTATELQEFLIEVTASPDRPRMSIFIDALDEGNENDVREMIAFFEDLGLHAISTSVPPRICLSSRHYPHISIRKGLSLVVEDQSEHDHDIEFYVRYKLHGGRSPEMHELQQEVCRKSAGIFLWIVLVVPMLNATYDRGGSLEATREHLKSIPAKLDALFTEILAKSAEDTNSCVSLLQWVLFSMRPLSPIELYYAMYYSYTSLQHGGVSPPDATRLTRYLLHYSRGLVEVTTAEPPVVQFIHETVRTFLLSANGLSHVQPEIAANVEGLSHAKLREACLRCLRCSELPSNYDPGNFKQVDPQIASDLKDNYPFLEYSVTSLFQHVDTAHSQGIHQTDFLETLCRAGGECFGRWVHFRNIFERFAARRYTLQVSILYTATEQNLMSLVQCLIERQVNVNTRGERYGNALQAACFAGNEKMARLLVKSGADVNAVGGEHGHALSAAIHSKHMPIAVLLHGYGASLTPQALVKLFMKTAARGYLQGVEFLLNVGADINARGGTYETALQVALKEGREKVVQMLLDKGADVETIGGYGNALHTASANGHERIVQILLDKGADVNTIGEHGSALHTASVSGHEKMVQILLDKGADVNAEGGLYGSALQAASARGHEKIVQMLLDKDADINIVGEHGSALYTASANGNERIVQMLLEKGADINIKGGLYGSVLQAALEKSHEKMVQLLLDKGADVNAIGGYYGSALQAASANGHEKMVQLLLDKGADVNARGGYYGSALQAASARGHEKMVQLLLDKGADVNARGGYYGSALYTASASGYHKIVQMLLYRAKML